MDGQLQLQTFEDALRELIAKEFVLIDTGEALAPAKLSVYYRNIKDGGGKVLFVLEAKS